MARRLLPVLCLAALVGFASCQTQPPEGMAGKAAQPERTQLTASTANDFAPRCSPNGERIAFTSDRGGNSDIFVASADGAGVTQLTPSNTWEAGAAWSPDGERIAFASDREGETDIFVMPAGGGRRSGSLPTRASSSLPIGLPMESGSPTRGTPTAIPESMSFPKPAARGGC